MAFLQSDRYWPEFCVLVDRFDWLADERFADSADRAEHTRGARRACSTSCSSSAPRRVAGAAHQAGRPVGHGARRPVRCSTTSRPSPTATSSAIEHDGEGKVVLVAAPVQFDGEAPTLGKAPAFGADTDDVLRDHGLDDDGHRRSPQPRRHRLTGAEDRPHRLRRPRRASSSTSPPPPTRPGSRRCGSASTSCCPSATPPPTRRSSSPAQQHHTGPIVDPDTELVDPLVQLGAAAAVTTRIELATGIFILPLRHPLAVARSDVHRAGARRRSLRVRPRLRLAGGGVHRPRRPVRRAGHPLRGGHRGTPSWRGAAARSSTRAGTSRSAVCR